MPLILSELDLGEPPQIIPLAGGLSNRVDVGRRFWVPIGPARTNATGGKGKRDHRWLAARSLAIDDGLLGKDGLLALVLPPRGRHPKGKPGLRVRRSILAARLMF